MSKNDIHIFLSTITIAGFTTPIGVSYSFIFLAFLYIIRNAKYFSSSKALILLLVVYDLFRITFLDDDILSTLNFTLVFLFMIGLKNYRPSKPILLLKFYIILSFIVVVLQILFKEQFNLFINQVYSSTEALGTKWRPNGISFEPSMASLFLIVAGYSLGKNLNPFYTLIIIMQIVLIQSSFGFAGLIFLLFYRWFRLKYLYIIIPFVVFLLPLSVKIDTLSDAVAIKRLSSVIVNLSSLEVDALVSADHSASIRIAPFLILTTQPWWQDGFLLPKSMAAYKNFIVDYLPGVDPDYWEGGGFLPSSIYTFGIFSLFLYRFIYKNFCFDFLSAVLLTICLINIPFSSQAFAVLLILSKLNISIKTKAV